MKNWVKKREMGREATSKKKNSQEPELDNTSDVKVSQVNFYALVSISSKD